MIANNEAGSAGSAVSQCCGPIVRCAITNNKVGNYIPQGAVYYAFNDKTLEIRDCIIARNDIYEGGGIWTQESNISLIGSTIWDLAEVYSGEAFAKNCILKEVYPDGSPNFHIEYSNVQGGWEGEGNIDIDPEFIDKWGDYHLLMSSPCVDAGDPAFVAEEGEVDIDGEPRVMGGRVDMGADEVGPKQADFTRDGRIDVSDLSVLSGAWDTMEGEGNWYVLSDLFEDGVIGLDDLVMFVDDWMWIAEWAD